jgi:hypothetical protein
VARRLTAEDALARAALKGCEPLEPYPGRSRLPWRVRHECGDEFSTTADRLGDKRGGVCERCGTVQQRRKRSHTDESALALIERMGANFVPDGPYPGNNRTPWPGKCSNGHTCSPTLGSIAAGNPPCPRCSGNRINDAEAMRRAEAKGFMPREPYPGVGSMSWHGNCATCGLELTVTGYNLGRGGRACEPCARRFAQQGRLISEQEAIRRARAKGCEPLEPYPGGTDTPWKVRHECGEEFHTNSGELGRAGVGACWKCGQASKTAKVISRCSETAVSIGYQVVDWEMRQASDSRRPFLTIMCVNGHAYDVAAAMFLAGQRCRRCKDDTRADTNAEECRVLAAKRSETILRTWLRDRGNGRSRLWLEIKCPDEMHPPYEMLAWNYKDKHGCPICNVGGGYDLARPGSLYSVAGRGWLKIGIANAHRLHKRLDDHRRQGLDEVIDTVTADDGKVAFDFERLWMIRRSDLTVLPTKRDLKDGWTESALDTPHLRDWVVTQFLPRVRRAAQEGHTSDSFAQDRQMLPEIHED